MARPLFDSEFIFGIHEPGGEQYMLEAGRPGWIVFTEGVGHDPNDQSGRDYRAYSDRGIGVIVRLNNGYYPNGTIPPSDRYAAFAQRCANFVAHSAGCKLWIIGNEMNFDIERPRYSAQPPLTLQQAAPEEEGTGEPAPEEVEILLPAEPANFFQRWWNAFLIRHEDRFFIPNEQGELIIARLSPKGYEEISRSLLIEPTNQVQRRSIVWSHPAFANRCVYARNDKQLLCVDLAER